MYLGFGEGIGMEEFERSLANLREEQEQARERVAALASQLEQQAADSSN